MLLRICSVRNVWRANKVYYGGFKNRKLAYVHSIFLYLWLLLNVQKGEVTWSFQIRFFRNCVASKLHNLRKSDNCLLGNSRDKVVATNQTLFQQQNQIRQRKEMDWKIALLRLGTSTYMLRLWYQSRKEQKLTSLR